MPIYAIQFYFIQCYTCYKRPFATSSLLLFSIFQDDVLEDSFASDVDALHENEEGSSASPFGTKKMYPVFLEEMEDAVSRLKGAVDESKNSEKLRILSLEERDRGGGDAK